MTIEKKGEISYSESYTGSGEDASVLTGVEKWNWLDTDKKKTFLVISDAGINLFGGGNSVVDKLSSSELILKRSYSNTEDGRAYSSDYTYTFEKQ